MITCKSTWKTGEQLLIHQSKNVEKSNNLGAKMFEGLVPYHVWWLLLYKLCFSDKDRTSNSSYIFNDSIWFWSSCCSEFTITAWFSSPQNPRAGLGLVNSLLFIVLCFSNWNSLNIAEDWQTYQGLEHRKNSISFWFCLWPGNGFCINNSNFLACFSILKVKVTFFKNKIFWYL